MIKLLDGMELNEETIINFKKLFSILDIKIIVYTNETKIFTT